MEPMNLQAIFFDIDDTLFDRERAQLEFLKLIAGQLPEVFAGIEMTKMAAAFLESDQASLAYYTVGQPSAIIRTRRSREFLRALNLDEGLAGMITEAYVEHYPGLDTPVAGAREVMAALTGKYRLGIISNGLPDVQHRKLRTLGVNHLVEAVVLSHELGIEKPHPGIFHHAASSLGVTLENSLYVGDSHANDVVGAKNAGMLSCWFNPGGKTVPAKGPSPDFETGALKEILGILGEG